MKSCVALIILAALSTLSCPSFAGPADPFIQQAQSNKLAQDITWQRLMYEDAKQHSEVSYSGYFYHEQGAQNLELELASNIQALDRKSTRLNSSHVKISYAVFCLKKKKNHILNIISY